MWTKLKSTEIVTISRNTTGNQLPGDVFQTTVGEAAHNGCLDDTGGTMTVSAYNSAEENLNIKRDWVYRWVSNRNE